MTKELAQILERLVKAEVELVLVGDLETLIQAKKAMGRPHDLITVQHLEAVKRRRNAE
jgi:hypothetical protein